MNYSVVRFYAVLLIAFMMPCFLESAALGCRRAEIKDVKEIDALFDGFDADDKSKLVVFPSPIREVILQEQVEQGKFFVACDDETGKIVAFLKLHLVEQAKLQDILESELCIGKGDALTNGHYMIARSEALDFKRELEFRGIPALHPNHRAMYIYYGGAYTLPEYRKHGISTTLQQKAFSSLAQEIIQTIKKHQLIRIYYLYGQVEANAESKQMIRVFADFIHSTLNKVLFHEDMVANYIRLFHQAYRAYKPDFEYNDGQLRPVFTEAGKGRGNILGYDCF